MSPPIVPSVVAVAAATGAAVAYCGAGVVTVTVCTTAVSVIACLGLLVAGEKGGIADSKAHEAGEAASKPWDYVIIGGGTAGCVLANRLTAGKNDNRVLVLEAGDGKYGKSFFRMPAGVLRLFKSKWDWNFTTSNETAASNRSIYLCRGKVLGGSSCLNVLLYNRGNATDYDAWETDFGCKDWKADDVLPYFKRGQADLTGLSKSDPRHHSKDGEWGVDHVRYQNELSRTFLEACKQKGLPANGDFNNWRRSQEGVGRFTVSCRNGEREHAANCMLEPALKDPARKLKVLTAAAVQQIVFEPSAATGGQKGSPVASAVRFESGGMVHTVKLAPGGEVLLAGGAIQSPQILMLSGIGPKQHLEEHGIKVVHDLPSVGENLQDHPAAVVSYQCPKSKAGIAVTSQIRLCGTPLPHPRPLLEWFMNGSGPLTSVGCDHGGFLRTAAAEDDSSPDLQLRFLPAQAISPDGMKTFANFKKTARHPDGFSFQSIAARPASRGRVRLSSGDPSKDPVIEGMYVSDKRDLATMREGLKLSRELAKQPAFADYVGHEVFPGKDVTTDQDLDEYIRSSVHTANALVGTCRMGQASDPAAVCDADMAVLGVQGLRVCDASVMPKLPGGQTGAITVMIAERASDVILTAKRARKL